MKMVIQIAKAELRNLFYSPVAWFLTIAFLVLFGWMYTTQLYAMVKMQDAYMEIKPDFKDLGPFPMTMSFFMPPNGVLRLVLENLYLFVPLLTMGLIGRETQMGTIKLLYSSPVKLRQIVGGKFLGVMVYNMLLVSIAAVFMFTFYFFMRSPDYGLFISSVLGLFLLACAYTAIGLFVSSLTSYQILAALGTFLIVFVLSRINGLWQQYDILRDITYFFYLPGRTSRMMKGLIASKDIVYYVMMVFMFLGFTLIRLKSLRESKPWYVKIMRIVMIVMITVGTGYFLSLPVTTKYWDLTAGERNTIHPNTQKVVADLNEGPLEVTLYVNLLGNAALYGLPEMRNEYLTSTWERILRFKTDIRFKYVYYYYYDQSMDGGALEAVFPGKNNEEKAREMAQSFKVNVKKFKTYAEIDDSINLHPEGQRLVMQLSYKGRKEFLRTYNGSSAESTFPTEENMAATFKRLAHPESIPRILYTSDNLERNLWKGGEREHHNYISKQYSTGLYNLGFDVDSISLEKGEIPSNITALVVADPKTAFSETVYRKIKKYMDEGGNIVFMGEPGKQELLNPLIKDLGVQMLDGSLVEPTWHEMPHMVNPYYTRAAPALADEIGLWQVSEKWKEEYFKDTMKMLMPGVAALSYTDSNGSTKKPLFLTVGTSTFIKKGKLVVDSAAVVYNQQEGDVKGSFPTVLQLTRQVGNKQQKAAIYGDADFINNMRWKNGEVINRAVFSWMTGNAYPVYAFPYVWPKDNLFLIKPRTAKLFHIAAVWILPSILLITAIVVLVRRKRK
jgi:ABC-2 type transport system permease protein